MANETQIGQLVIDLKIKTEALEKGLETAKNRLKEIEQNNKDIENSNKNLDASYLAMSATAVLALSKIGSAIKECVEEYNSYTQSMSSLQNVSEYTGESMQDFSKIMSKFSTYMTKSDIATTIKNFSLMGMTAKQTEQMIEALTNSAIRNRNANYTVSEAVKVASEGYRQGLSTLSDSAGVTENLSVQLDIYAKSIGKTASQLTEAEKNQAYLNRTMYAAEPFAGAMADYLDTLAGKQGQYSQAMRETQVAYAEALEPILKSLTEMGTGILTFLNEAIEKNPSLIAGMTTFTVTLTGATIAIIALTAAKKAYSTATGVATVSTKAFTAALLANPITWWIVGISAAVGVITTAVSKFNNLKDSLNELKEELDKTTEAQDRYNKMVEGTLEKTDENIKKVREDKAVLEQQIATRKKLDTELNKGIETFEKSTNTQEKDISVTKKMNLTRESARKELGNYNKFLLENRDAEIKQHRQQLINIAQTKADIQGKQELLNILKQGKTSTEQYADAKSQLVKVYPELAKVNENTINSTQAMIDSENKAADAEWANAQVAIQASILEVSAMMSNSEQIITIAEATQQSVEQVTASLQNQMEVLGNLAKLSPSDFKGSVTTSYKPKATKSSGGGSKSGGSSSNTNTALDNYKKQIEHKKALDQISLQQEIAMYQTALNKYAKTADEKMELTEKIYSLQKELQEKSLDDYTADIEHRKALDQISLQDEINMYQYAYNALAKTTEQKRELEEKLYELRKELQEKTLNDYTEDIQHRKALDQISLQDEVNMYQYALNNYAKTAEQKKEIRETIYQLNKEIAQKEKELLEQQVEDYRNYMEDQERLRGADYSIDEQTKDYDKIIEMHKKYLNQIMKDERLSLEERKDIYREELLVIRDYEQQKRDLRVSAIDDTVSQLTNAITKQLEDAQEKEKDLLDKNLDTIEQWKDARIDAINEEYDARIEAIEKELEALEKAEQQKTRDEEDAEYEKKKLRLEQLIAYEHDATTKANYQKELDKLVAEHQKTLDKRALTDKKEALKEQKELLKQEQDDKVKQIEDETEKRKEEYNKQLKALEEYYGKQIEKAEETAQAMLLNAEQNQNEILNLLQSYGDAYETTGQSFGEKLAQGFTDTAMEKIQNAISKVQTIIDNAIENNIARLATATEKYSAGAIGTTVVSKTVTVEQNNTITSPVDSPSIAYKKQETLNRNLANQIASIF